MNILEHIKAGHYPTDTLGRPLIKVFNHNPPYNGSQYCWVVVLEIFGDTRINTRYAHTRDLLATWTAEGKMLGPRGSCNYELLPPDDWEEVVTWVKKK